MARSVLARSSLRSRSSTGCGRRIGADHARHRDWLAAAIDRGAGLVDVDAVERGGEAVGIAFAPLLAVGNDVEPGALLVADGEDGGVVLRRFELVFATSQRSSARTRGTCFDSLSRSISQSACG